MFLLLSAFLCLVFDLFFTALPCLCLVLLVCGLSLRVLAEIPSFAPRRVDSRRLPTLKKRFGATGREVDGGTRAKAGCSFASTSARLASISKTELDKKHAGTLRPHDAPARPEPRKPFLWHFATVPCRKGLELSVLITTAVVAALLSPHVVVTPLLIYSILGGEGGGVWPPPPPPDPPPPPVRG